MSYKISNININKLNPGFYNKIFEDKSIILGLIDYITVKYDILQSKYIYINLERFKNIIVDLFPKLNFVKTEKTSDFKIFIKSLETGDVNINNINLIKKFDPKNIYCLPWFDYENPIIMYTSFPTSSNKFDKNKVLNKFKSFSFNNRGKYSPKDIESSYNDSWDIYIEDIILSNYINKFKSWSYEDLSKFINNMFTNTVYIDKIIKKKINVPVPTPYYIPVPFQSNQNVEMTKIEKNNINPTIISSPVEKKLKELEKLNKELKNKIDDKDIEILNLNLKKELNEYKTLKNDLDKKNIEINNFKNEIDKYKKQDEENTTELTNITERNQKLVKELEDFKIENKTNRQYIKELKKNKTDLLKCNEEKNKIEEELKKLIFENSKLTDNNNKLTDNNNKLTDNNNKLTDNNNKLTDNNNKLTEEHNKLKDQIEKLIFENNELIKSIKACNKLKDNKLKDNILKETNNFYDNPNVHTGLTPEQKQKKDKIINLLKNFLDPEGTSPPYIAIDQIFKREWNVSTRVSQYGGITESDIDLSEDITYINL